MYKSTHQLPYKKGFLKVVFYAPVYREDIGAGPIDVGIGIIYDHRYELEIGDIDWDRSKRKAEENEAIQKYLDSNYETVKDSIFKAYDERNSIDY